ncbi:MAG: chloride channel protein, partial [Bacteroidota bacterium]
MRAHFGYLWAMKGRALLHKVLVWRIKHIPDRNFVLLLSGIVGVLAGLAAVLLKETVHFIQHEVQALTQGSYRTYIRVAIPAFGIILTGWVARYLFRERLGHGITDILYTISRRASVVPRSRMWSRMITSAVTVGLGGSVGLESPIVVTGSAIGSNMGQLMHLDSRKRALLIGCGTAGAIAGIFNSPVAGVIFAIEVILTDVTAKAFIPLLISAVSGALVSLTLLGDDVLFSFRYTDTFTAADIPFYLLLGIFTGFVSLYFTRAMYRIEGGLERVQSNAQRIALGALGLAVVIFILPALYGEGYDFIKGLLNRDTTIITTQGSWFGEQDGKQAKDDEKRGVSPGAKPRALRG